MFTVYDLPWGELTPTIHLGTPKELVWQKFLTSSHRLRLGDKVYYFDPIEELDLKQSCFGVITDVSVNDTEVEIRIHPETEGKSDIYTTSDYVVKIEAEISDQATWVEDYQDLTEEQVKFVEYSEESIEADTLHNTKIKALILGPCGHFH